MSLGDRPKDEEKRGFGGLADMVSDVETPAAATPASATPPPQTRPVSDAAPRTVGRAPAPAAPSPPAPYQRTAQQARPPNGGKWLIGVAVVLAVVWMIAQSSGRKASPARASSGSPRPAPRAASAPEPLDESKPSPGSDLVLTTSQIRYCLAEDIRLGAAKGVVNAYSDADVDRFNAMVTDYNSRCGQYRYRQGTLESARSAVERHRTELEVAGRSRFGRSHNSAGTVPNSGSEQKEIDWRALFAELSEGEARNEPIPDPTVRSIQRGLTALGYDAGPADGLMGARTKSAILSFQQAQGIVADGVASPSLLQYLSLISSNGPTGRATPDRSTVGERRPDLSSATAAERNMIEDACNGARLVSGPGAYRSCLERELRELGAHPTKPDLSSATAAERGMIEDACSGARLVSGPGAYYSCLERELRELRAHPRKPDLSRVTSAERRMIEDACNGARLVSGPGAYYSCLERELAKLGGV